MVDPAILREELKLPYGYRQISKKIRETLRVNGYPAKLESYCAVKQELGINDYPRMISDHLGESDEFVIQNIKFYQQAKYFGELAKNAIPETKPLVIHYAEQSLFAFFVYSIFSYPTSSTKHGLEIVWNTDYKDIKVRIRKYGFFPRIIDCYSIFEANTGFAIAHYSRKDDNTYAFVKSTNDNAFSQESALSLTQLTQRREEIGTNRNGFVYDVIDYLLIFIASSLARYKPFLWDKVVKGEQGTELVMFNKAFDRFELLHTRLVNALLQLAMGLNPEALIEFDFQSKNLYDGI